jgi:hypothetical protein
MIHSSRRVRALVVIAVVAMVLPGCGGPEDPFADRTPVSGVLMLDGAPVQWGSLKLIGQRKEETQEQAIDMIAVRDGKFQSEEGAFGTTPGQNEAEVIIFAEEPTEEKDNVKMKGMWRGAVTVAADAPLTLDLKSSDLQKSLAP